MTCAHRLGGECPPMQPETSQMDFEPRPMDSGPSPTEFEALELSVEAYAKTLGFGPAGSEPLPMELATSPTELEPCPMDLERCPMDLGTLPDRPSTLPDVI